MKTAPVRIESVRSVSDARSHAWLHDGAGAGPDIDQAEPHYLRALAIMEKAVGQNSLELAPILEGKPDVTQIDRIELERLAREFRTQRIIFEAAPSARGVTRR